MKDDDDLTAEGMLRLIERRRAVSVAMKDSRENCREAWNAAGFASEIAIKLVILRRLRLNTWPSKDHRQDLHTHDIRKLLDLAGIEGSSVPTEMRKCLKLAMDWRRSHDYVATRMPRKIARDMHKAVFEEGGLVEWLETLK